MARPVVVSNQQILSGAGKLFASEGYGQVSLRQLIKASGVSTTAFYARFPSKEAVFIALVEHMLAELYQRASTFLPKVRSVEEGVASGIDVLLTVTRKHRRILALALTEGVAIEPIRRALHRALSDLAQLIEVQLDTAARAAGRPTGNHAPHAWAVVGALHMQVMRWAVFGSVSTAQLPAVLHDTAAGLLLQGDRS